MRFARGIEGEMGHIVIEAPTWFDARNVAASMFGEGPDVLKYEGLEHTHIEARWKGVEVNGGQRLLEIREMKEGAWTDWRLL
jgi:hypothetical protein